MDPTLPYFQLQIFHQTRAVDETKTYIPKRRWRKKKERTKKSVVALQILKIDNEDDALRALGQTEEWHQETGRVASPNQNEPARACSCDVKSRESILRKGGVRLWLLFKTATLARQKVRKKAGTSRCFNILLDKSSNLGTFWLKIAIRSKINTCI